MNAAGITFAFLVSFTCFSCSKSEVKSRSFFSPDKEYIATISITDLGACCTPRTTVIIEDKSNNFSKPIQTVFKGSGGWPVTGGWNSNESFVIEFPGAEEYWVRSSILKDKALLKTGEIRYVFIVVNPKSVQNSGDTRNVP